MYYVYVLQNSKGSYYIGSCNDTEVRLKRHNQNSVKSTKNKGSFKVIYKDKCVNRTEAIKREKELKSCKGNAKFKKIIGA